MKKLIGIFIILLVICFIGVLGLRIWDIYIVSLDIVIRSSFTLLLLGVLIVILTIVYGGLLKNNSKRYNKQVGNNAHPKL